MVETIRNAWSWAGLNPAEIVYTNPFGNLIVKVPVEFSGEFVLKN